MIPAAMERDKSKTGQRTGLRGTRLRVANETMFDSCDLNSYICFNLVNIKYKPHLLFLR